MMVRTSTGAFHTEILTSSDPTPESTTEVEVDGDVKGVQVTWGSEEPCAAGGTYSFSAKVMCNKLTTGTSSDIIDHVDKTDECNPIVTINHESGCPISTGNELTQWLDNNPWFLAVVLLIVGPIVAFFGKKWFPNIAAIVACLFVMQGIAVLAGQLGWLSTSWSPWVVLAVALILGICVGGIVQKKIWFAVGLMGVVAGVFLGLFLFSIMAATTNHAENWEMITFAVVLGIVGGFTHFKWGQQLVVIGTSFIGSYLFMRGLTFIFEGYPAETEIWSDIREGHELEITSNFWIFIGVWVAGFVISMIVQFKAMEDHDELKNHYARVH